jgi:hypothetical protein
MPLLLVTKLILKNQKVVKNLIEGIKIQTPVTLTFFLINPN